jgi:hypothetical protein
VSNLIVVLKCEEKRKKTRKEQKASSSSDKKSKTSESEAKIDEDDPDKVIFKHHSLSFKIIHPKHFICFVKYRHAIYVMTCKLFADIERLKVREAEKAAEEK